MTAMEKTAWAKLLVALTAVAVAALLNPWLENAALGAFGLLYLTWFAEWWFPRRRGTSVVVDERDREIDRLANSVGIGTAWTILVLALFVIILWSELFHEETVPNELLAWLLLIDAAICTGVEGLVGVLAYRRQGHAA